jgi:curved DNA-binding protein CbpA
MTETSSIVTEIISLHPDLVGVLFGTSPVDSATQTQKLRGLSNEERQKLVRTAYRRRAVAVHPDKCRDPRGPQAFNNLKRAQEILLDDQLAAMFLADRGTVQDRFASTQGFEDMMKHTGGNFHFGYFLFGVAFIAGEKLATASYHMFCPSSFLRRRNTARKADGSFSPLDWMRREREAFRKIIVNEEEFDKLIEKRRKKQEQNPYYFQQKQQKNVDTGLLSADDEELFGVFSIVKRVVRWDRIVRLVGLLLVILSIVIGVSLHLGSIGPGASGRNGCSIVELVNRGSKCFNYEEEDGSNLRRESGLRRVKLTISRFETEVEENAEPIKNETHDDDGSSSYFPNSNKNSSEWIALINEQTEKRTKNSKFAIINNILPSSKNIETTVGCRLSISKKTEDEDACSPILTKLAYQHYLSKELIKESWKMRRKNALR